MLSFDITTGGYVIQRDGSAWIVQDYDPRKPFVGGQGQPFDSAEAAAEHATAAVAELEAQLA